MRTRVTKIFKFEMAHRLDGCYSEECKQIHGHSYRLEVTFEGHMNEDGMVMDFKQVKEAVQPLVDSFDHKLVTSKEFGGKNPTAENMAMFFFDRIRQKIIFVHKVRLWETDTCYAEVCY